MGTPTWQLSIGVPTSRLSLLSAGGEMVWVCVRTSGKFRWQFHQSSPTHPDISKTHFWFNIRSHMIRRLATFARKPLCTIIARYWQLFKQAEVLYWKPFHTRKLWDRWWCDGVAQCPMEHHHATLLIQLLRPYWLQIW